MKGYLIAREETYISWFDCRQLLVLLLFAGLDYNHLVILQEDSLSNLTYHPNHSVIANSALKLNIVNLTNLQVWYSSTHFQSMEPLLPLGKPFHIQTALAASLPDGIILWRDLALTWNHNLPFTTFGFEKKQEGQLGNWPSLINIGIVIPVHEASIWYIISCLLPDSVFTTPFLNDKIRFIF